MTQQELFPINKNISKVLQYELAEYEIHGGIMYYKLPVPKFSVRLDAKHNKNTRQTFLRFLSNPNNVTETRTFLIMNYGDTLAETNEYYSYVGEIEIDGLDHWIFELHEQEFSAIKSNLKTISRK